MRMTRSIKKYLSRVCRRLDNRCYRAWVWGVYTPDAYRHNRRQDRLGQCFRVLANHLDGVPRQPESAWKALWGIMTI